MKDDTRTHHCSPFVLELMDMWEYLPIEVKVQTIINILVRKLERMTSKQKAFVLAASIIAAAAVVWIAQGAWWVAMFVGVFVGLIIGLILRLR